MSLLLRMTLLRLLGPEGRAPEVEVPTDVVRSVLEQPAGLLDYEGRPEMFRTWSFGPWLWRSCTPREGYPRPLRFLAAIGRDHELDGEWAIETIADAHCGSVDHLTFHAANADGSATRMLRVLFAWSLWREEEYPLTVDERVLLGTIPPEEAAARVQFPEPHPAALELPFEDRAALFLEDVREQLGTGVAILTYATEVLPSLLEERRRAGKAR